MSSLYIFDFNSFRCTDLSNASYFSHLKLSSWKTFQNSEMINYQAYIKTFFSFFPFNCFYFQNLLLRVPDTLAGKQDLDCIYLLTFSIRVPSRKFCISVVNIEIYHWILIKSYCRWQELVFHKAWALKPPSWKGMLLDMQQSTLG